MSDDELKAIEARASAATPGPWRVLRTTETDGGLALTDRRIVCDASADTRRHPAHLDNAPAGTPEGEQSDADNEFSAHAREDIPKLIAEVRRLKGELQDMAYERMEELEMLEDSTQAERDKVGKP